MQAITANPDGTQVYVAALLSTDSTLNTRPDSTGAGGGTANFPRPDTGGSSGYGSTGACGVSSAVAAPALLKFAVTGTLACAVCYGLAGLLLRLPPVRRVLG